MTRIIIKNVCFIGILNLIVVLLVLKSNSTITINTNNLVSRLTNVKGNGVMQELLSFDYDKVYVFEPYQTKEDMQKLIGFKFNDLKETTDSGMMNILFVKGSEPIAYVYGSPMVNGYYLNLPIGVYTALEMGNMHYISEIRGLGNSAGTPQTYTFYSIS